MRPDKSGVVVDGIRKFTISSNKLSYIQAVGELDGKAKQGCRKHDYGIYEYRPFLQRVKINPI